MKFVLELQLWLHHVGAVDEDIVAIGTAKVKVLLLEIGIVYRRERIRDILATRFRVMSPGLGLNGIGGSG
ncbi:MAG: hypothetical protein O7G88_20280 [bacterium]|nr:hypothetical protein [bacterium]